MATTTSSNSRFENASRDELLTIALQQRSELDRLKEQLQNNKSVPTTTTTTTTTKTTTTSPVRKQREKESRAFDWQRYSERHIALRIAYAGWDYDGLARQETTLETVEEHLMLALEGTKLIQDRVGCAVSRSGRTDKGVSAAAQVLSLRLRSNASSMSMLGVVRVGEAAKATSDDDELDYGHLINRRLPVGIRVTGWTPVPLDFSARFSARARFYRYLLPLRGRKNGPLALSRMNEAAQKLVGERDFRHLCKVDLVNAERHVRRIVSAEVVEVVPGEMAELRVRGTAFLWRQIRHIAAVLMLVGEGKEEPSVIDFLLDVDNVKGKPNYIGAAPEPLCLSEISYDEPIPWRLSKTDLEATRADITDWTELHSMKSTILRSFLSTLDEGVHIVDNAKKRRERKKYTPLAKRPRGKSLEELHATLSDAKRQRLEDKAEWVKQFGRPKPE